MVDKAIMDRIKKHNEICDQLREKGYTIQGSKMSEKFKKCYFSEGKAPFTKIVGYIDKDTLEIVYL